MEADQLRMESRSILDQATINDIMEVCDDCSNEDCLCEPPNDDARDGFDTVE